MLSSAIENRELVVFNSLTGAYEPVHRGQTGVSWNVYPLSATLPTLSSLRVYYFSQLLYGIMLGLDYSVYNRATCSLHGPLPEGPDVLFTRSCVPPVALNYSESNAIFIVSQDEMYHYHSILSQFQSDTTKKVLVVGGVTTSGISNTTLLQMCIDITLKGISISLPCIAKTVRATCAGEHYTTPVEVSFSDGSFHPNIRTPRHYPSRNYNNMLCNVFADLHIEFLSYNPSSNSTLLQYPPLWKNKTLSPSHTQWVSLLYRYAVQQKLETAAKALQTYVEQHNHYYTLDQHGNYVNTTVHAITPFPKLFKVQ